jgi:hypothetical protein
MPDASGEPTKEALRAASSGSVLTIFLRYVFLF